MRLFHMSFNLMTLGGLAACIGVVIDDAIVMVENISVHMALGQDGREASLNAIRELTPALIGSTLTPIMVFVPLVFLGGITAVFFRALAMTMVTALIASLLLAVLFTPVLARLFVRPTRREDVVATIEEAEQEGEGRVMRRLAAGYERALSWSLGTHAGADCRGPGPGAARWASTTSSARAFCRRWTKARSCWTTSCPPERRSRRPTACCATSSACCRPRPRWRATRGALARSSAWPSPSPTPAISWSS